jgi:hypothetical protein
MFATFINAAHAQYDPIRLYSYFSVSSDGKFLLHGQCGTQAVQSAQGWWLVLLFLRESC